MRPQAPYPIHDDLDRILVAAARTVGVAQQYFYAGHLDGEIRDCLHEMQLDMAGILARYGDGKLYGYVTPSGLAAVRSYEQIAADLLHASEPKPQGMMTDTKDSFTRLEPGLYEVCRELKLPDGEIEKFTTQCHNPAFAFLLADHWEARVRMQRGLVRT